MTERRGPGREDRPTCSRDTAVKRTRSMAGFVDEAVPPSTRSRRVDRVERNASFESSASTVLSPSVRKSQKGKGRAKAKESLPQTTSSATHLGNHSTSFHDDEDTATAFNSASIRRMGEDDPSTPSQGHSSGISTPSQGHSSGISTPSQGHSSGISTPSQGHSSGISTPSQGHSSGITPSQGHSSGITPSQGHSSGITPSQGHSSGVPTHEDTAVIMQPVSGDGYGQTTSIQVGVASVRGKKGRRVTRKAAVTAGNGHEAGTTSAGQGMAWGPVEQRGRPQSTERATLTSNGGVSQTSHTSDPIPSQPVVQTTQASSEPMSPPVSNAQSVHLGGHTAEQASSGPQPVVPPTGGVSQPVVPADEHSTHSDGGTEQPNTSPINGGDDGVPRPRELQTSGHLSETSSAVQPVIVQVRSPSSDQRGTPSPRLRPGRQCSRGGPPSLRMARDSSHNPPRDTSHDTSHDPHTAGLRTYPTPPPHPPSIQSQLQLPTGYMYAPPTTHHLAPPTTHHHAPPTTHHLAPPTTHHHAPPTTHHHHPVLWVNTSLMSPPTMHGSRVYYTQGQMDHTPQAQGHPLQAQGQHPTHPHQGQGHPPQGHRQHPYQGQGHPPQGHGHPPQGQGHPPQGQGQGHPSQSHPSHPSSFQTLPSSVVHWGSGPNPHTGQRDTVLFEVPRTLQRPGDPMLWSDAPPTEAEMAEQHGGAPRRGGGAQGGRGARSTGGPMGAEQEVPRWRGRAGGVPLSHDGERGSRGEGVELGGGRSMALPLYLTEENHLPYIPLMRVVSSDHPLPPQQSPLLVASSSEPRGTSTSGTSMTGSSAPGPSTAGSSAPGPSTTGSSAPGPSTAGSLAPGPSTAGPSAPGPSHSNVEVIVVDDDSSDEDVLTPRRRRRARRRQQRRRRTTTHRPPGYVPDDEEQLIRDNYSALATRVSQWTHEDARRFLHAASSATATRPRSREEWMNAVGSMAPEVLYRVIIGPYVSVPAGVLSGGGGSYEELIELAERLGPGGPQGIAPEVIDTIPVRAYSRHPTDKASRCVVCMNDFEDEDRVRSLPCSHEFHQPCIDKWFESHRSCPLCRGEVLIQ